MPSNAPLSPTHRSKLHCGCCAFLASIACVGPATDSSYSPSQGAPWAGYVPDLPVALPPYDQVQASWKQRLDQPYVYLEHVGSYTETGSLIPLLQREMLAQELEPAGPPFALFFDDPGSTPVAALRSRTCIPVGGKRSPHVPLQYDVLPSTTVVYALVGGPYPDVPRAYPGLYAYLERQNWIENGPLREIYLIPPSSVQSLDDLLTEVQLPATARP